jgi:hypothetical protein
MLYVSESVSASTGVCISVNLTQGSPYWVAEKNQKYAGLAVWDENKTEENE